MEFATYKIQLHLKKTGMIAYAQAEDFRTSGLSTTVIDQDFMFRALRHALNESAHLPGGKRQ